MAFDHKEIIEKGLEHLRKTLDYDIVGSNLPEKFTMKDLQNLYEAILGEKFRRNNFQRKMLNLNILDRHEKLLAVLQIRHLIFILLRKINFQNIIK